MKRVCFLGTVLAITAMFLFSCNPNRFDFEHLDSVEGSGQWKIPIGTLRLTLGDVMKQMGQDGQISYVYYLNGGNDSLVIGTNENQGDFAICVDLYSEQLRNIIKAEQFLNLGSQNFTREMEVTNPYVGAPPALPKDTTLYFSESVKLNNDSIGFGIETAIIKSGMLVWTVYTNLADIDMTVSSPDIFMPNGDTLCSSNNHLDLTGATFKLHDPVTGEPDTLLTINCSVHFQHLGLTDPTYHIKGVVDIENLRVQEVSGYIGTYEYEIPTFETALSLPFEGFNAEASLIGAELKILEKNTFEGLYADLVVDYAEFCNNGVPASHLFNNYPFTLEVVPSSSFTNIMPADALNIHLSTDYTSVRFGGKVILNPNGMDQKISVYDTSSFGLMLSAMIPLQFNVPKAHFSRIIDKDSIGINLSGVTTPEMIDEIMLSMLFVSEMPINLKAQIYTLDPNNANKVTDSLFMNPFQIKGSFDGDPVRTDVVVDVTNERLSHLVDAEKVLLNFEVDTDQHDVKLTKDKALTVTVKTDVKYHLDEDMFDLNLGGN